MEVLVGPTFTIDVSSSPPPPPHGGGDCPRDEDSGERAVPSFLFDGGSVSYGGDSSESSSSIGTPDDNDDENDEASSKREDEEGEEVQSKLKGLDSMDSLEDNLPIKRGLSSHFTGKSKSFTDLSQVSSVKELQKQENPFNKRRRVLIASKWSKRSSFYNWSNPKSMPLLPVDEDQDDYDDDDHDEEAQDKSMELVSPSEVKNPEEQVQLRQLHNRVPQSYAARTRLRLGSFKSRSFSLADLQERDNEEEEDEENNDY